MISELPSTAEQETVHYYSTKSHSVDGKILTLVLRLVSYQSQKTIAFANCVKMTINPEWLWYRHRNFL